MSEEWHKTHAVLLKSVAEGKLLAAQNELQGDIGELHKRVFALSGQIKGLGDGLVDEIRNARDAITECDARNIEELERRLTAQLCSVLDFTKKRFDALVAKRSTKRKPRGRRK
jgi:hypothetical protein